MHSTFFREHIPFVVVGRINITIVELSLLKCRLVSIFTVINISLRFYNSLGIFFLHLITQGTQSRGVREVGALPIPSAERSKVLVFTSSHRGAKQEELLVVSFEVGVFMVTGVLFNRKQQTLFSKTRMGSCLAQVRVREIILFGRSEGTFLNKLKNKVSLYIYIYIYAHTHVRPHQIKYARRGINCIHVHDLHPCSRASLSAFWR